MGTGSAYSMTAWERTVLLLLALPFSTVLAAATYWLLAAPPAHRVGAAFLVFVLAEYVLHRLAARIRSPVGADALHGREAEVLVGFRPDAAGGHAGRVRIDGVNWHARLMAGGAAPPARGAVVRIVRRDGLVLWVTPTVRAAREAC